MKFTCDREKLTAAVNSVQRAVLPRASLPALEGILVSTGDGCVTLTAYNLEMGISSTVQARSIEGGSIVFSSKLFGDIVRRMSSEDITVSVSGNDAIITSGSVEFCIATINASEYPAIPEIVTDRSITMPQNILRSMIRQTCYAVSQNDIKPVLKGVLIEADGKMLRFVALDGFRLAIREESLEKFVLVGNGQYRFIVPAKTLSELLYITSDSEDHVTLCMSNHHMVVSTEDVTLFSRLIDGEFLNYKNAIPAETSLTVRANAGEIADSLDRAQLLINERIKSPVEISIDEGSMNLLCKTQLGRVNDNIRVEMEGTGIKRIGMSCRFMLDALRAAETETVIMQFKNEISPVVIRPESGNSFLFMVLPVRL